jgi:hypothetical protein
MALETVEGLRKLNRHTIWTLEGSHLHRDEEDALRRCHSGSQCHNRACAFCSYCRRQDWDKNLHTSLDQMVLDHPGQLHYVSFTSEGPKGGLDVFTELRHHAKKTTDALTRKFENRRGGELRASLSVFETKPDLFSSRNDFPHHHGLAVFSSPTSLGMRFLQDILHDGEMKKSGVTSLEGARHWITYCLKARPDQFCEQWLSHLAVPDTFMLRQEVMLNFDYVRRSGGLCKRKRKPALQLLSVGDVAANADHSPAMHLDPDFEDVDDLLGLLTTTTALLK